MPPTSNGTAAKQDCKVCEKSRKYIITKNSTIKLKTRDYCSLANGEFKTALFKIRKVLSENSGRWLSDIRKRFTK